MNYYQYNIACLITSILALLLVLYKYNEINLCLILILAIIFSILWRSTKVFMGYNKIEEDENGNINKNKQLKHPLFLLDLIFAILAFICVLYSNQVNKKFILITILVLIIAWIIYTTTNNNYIEVSNRIHFLSHCYVVFIIFITFYLYIR